MKLLSIGGWQDGLARFQSRWMSDPAAVQGWKWAGYSATLPLWPFLNKETDTCARDTFCFFKHTARKEYKMWWRFKNRSAFAEATSAWHLTQFHFLFVNETHLFRFLSPGDKLTNVTSKLWFVTNWALNCMSGCVVAANRVFQQSNTTPLDVKQWVPLWFLSNTPIVAQVEQCFVALPGLVRSFT